MYFSIIQIFLSQKLYAGLQSLSFKAIIFPHNYFA